MWEEFSSCHFEIKILHIELLRLRTVQGGVVKNEQHFFMLTFHARSIDIDPSALHVRGNHLMTSW